MVTPRERGRNSEAWGDKRSRFSRKNVAVVMPKNRYWQDTGRNFGQKLSIDYGKRNRPIAGYCSYTSWSTV